MKNFKEFIKDYEDGNFTYNDKTLAYAAYCQGFAEGKEKAFETVCSLFGGNDWQADKATDHGFIDDKMQVYPEQLVKEYSPEELKEIKKAMARTSNLSEEERKACFAKQVEELKQNPNSVLNAMAMQKAAEKVEEK